MSAELITITAVLTIVSIFVIGWILLIAVKADMVEHCVKCRSPLPENQHALCDRCCERIANSDRPDSEVIQDTTIMRITP